MTKLLQHIINAGDVSHKILPTYQMRGEVKYDNIPSPASMRSKAELDFQFRKMQAAKTQAAQNAQRYGVIRQAEAPQSMASKAWSIATNPMTALAYKVQGRDIPDYLERGPKNSLDIAANMVNPFAIAEAVKSIPGNVARGEFLNAGLNALNVIPAAKVASKFIKTAAPNVNKAVQAFGPNNSNKGFINYMTARGVEFDPGAIIRDYGYGIKSGLTEAIPNAIGAGLRKTGIYPKAKTVGRPFSEVFPTGAKKAQAIKVQDEAFDNAMNFVNEYFYPGGSNELRPIVADKIRSMYPNVSASAENFNKFSSRNPFDETTDRLVTSTSWGSGREGLDLFDVNYINKNRGSVEGFNTLGSSITLRNNGPYYKTPYDIARTAVHEAAHTSQKLGYVPDFKNPNIINTPLTWGNEIAQYNDEIEYYTSNPNTGLGRLFGKNMIDDNSWASSPKELHSELISEKYVDYLKSFDSKNPNVALQNRTLNTKLIDELANPNDQVLKRILERGELNKHFRPEATTEEKLKLLRMLPAVAPVAVAGALGVKEQKYGGESNIFRVFAQEGVEYKGPSIVDYLATKGYSGNKAFRKELAEKYGIEGYNYSAAKNTELLNRLRQDDELLQQSYEPTQAAIPVERMVEMERQAREARQAAAQQVPQQAPKAVTYQGSYYTPSPEIMNMSIPKPKFNLSAQPKAVYDKFSLTPKMVVSASKVTAPKPVVPVQTETPRSTLPLFNPNVFGNNVQNMNQFLGPLSNARQNAYVNNKPAVPVNQEMSRPIASEGEFSMPLYNAFQPFEFLNQRKSTLGPYIPANKPAVETKKQSVKQEVVNQETDLPWYEKLYKGFEDAVNNSPLDFKGINFGAGFSPEGNKQITRDLSKGVLSLFSEDLAQKFENKLDRQNAIFNPNERKSSLDPSKIKFDPVYVTGDTIPDTERRYHIPELMDLDYMRFGVRNRGDYNDIQTEGAPITAFEAFENSKQYFANNNDPANSTYIGVSSDGKIKVGGKDQFQDQEYQITKTFGNKVIDFNRDDKGTIKKVPSNPKASKETLSPSIKVLGDDGKVVDGKLSLLLPREGNQEESFDLVTGGRYILQTPDGKTKLVSGSLKNIESAFYDMKKNHPYVNVITLDNGSYARGIRTYDQKLTKKDLKGYDNQNTAGGNFAYILPGVTTRYESKFSDFEKEAKARLQAKYPGKNVSVGYQNSGLYDKTGARDIESQAAIQQRGNSQTPVSLHNFNAARDYILYVDGKPINADANKDLYADILWNSAAKTGLYHVGSKEDNWDPTHIGLAKEGQKTAFDELYSKYPDIFANPNFVKSLNFVNQNKSNPNYQEYYELLNNLQPFTGIPRVTEAMKRTAKKAYGGELCYECGGSVKRYDVGGYYDCPDQEKDPVTGKCAAEVVRGREANAANKAAGKDMNAWAKQVAAMDKENIKRDAAQTAGQLSFDYDWMQSQLDKVDKKAAVSQYKQFFQQNPNVFVADDTSGYSPEQKYVVASKLKQRISTPMGSKLFQQQYGVDPRYYDLQRLQSEVVPKLGGWNGMRNWLFNVYKQQGGPIIDPMGQWAHPGKMTRIPGSNITMQGVPYPVLGVGSNGQEQMMYPEQDYNFSGASYVDEYPMMKNGGGLLSRSVSCSNCGWSWKAVEGGIDPLTCHKCGGIVKMQRGGQQDSTLENILEVFDPTGISSWDDVYRSANDPNSKWYDTAIEVAGALPLVGKLGKLAEAGIHLKKYKGLEKAAFNMMPKSTALSKTLQGAALLGRATDAIQAGVAAPKASFFPSAPLAGVGQFGRYAGMPPFEKKNGGQHGGLDRWFAEKWVDVKSGKACGRQEGEKRAGYPACRPSKRVSSETPKTSSEMSSAEKAKFKSSKTSSQRIDYNHKRNK